MKGLPVGRLGGPQLASEITVTIRSWKSGPRITREGPARLSVACRAHVAVDLLGHAHQHLVILRGPHRASASRRPLPVTPDAGPDGQGLRATYRLFGHSIRPLPVTASNSSVDFGHFTLNDFISSVTRWFSRALPSALQVRLEIRVPGPWASPSSCVLSSGRWRGFHSGGPLTVPPQNCGSITHPQRRPRPDPPNP